MRLYAVIGAAALVLSMGADPTVWGMRLPIGMVYRWLFAYVPGFNGLRVPARFSTVVLLALAVLASVGFARIVSGMRPRARIVACVAVLAIILLEGTGGAMPLAFLAPHGRPDRAAYAWVRDGGAGAVLELPAGELDTTFRTYQYEYQTLFHHRHIVNGASGYNSALQVFLGSSASPLVEPPTSRTGCARCGRPVWHGRRAYAGVCGPGNRCVDRRALQTGAGDRVGGSQVVSEAVFPEVVVYRLAEWREAAAQPATCTA